MSSYYLKSGSRWDVTNKANVDIHDVLPVGTYTVKYDERSGQFFLQRISDFEIKGKVYGDTLATADRIFNTFGHREGSTGVLLSGEKGGGKTLLAKQLSILASGKSYPTIVINQPWHGEGFNSFMQSIEQESVVIFDEFEKVYDKEKQEALLTLLDGVYPSKKLFILTCNDKYRVDAHMQNRPGRIFYRIEYSGLPVEFITEYCQDNLNDKSQIERVAQISVLFNQFNFDMLKALVEEMNRYSESPQDAMKYLNAKPEYNDHVEYELVARVVKPDGTPVPDDMVAGRRWQGNPLTTRAYIYWYASKEDKEEGDSEVMWFEPSDLRKVDAESGAFEYVNKGGSTLSAVRVKPPKVDYWGAL